MINTNIHKQIKTLQIIVGFLTGTLLAVTLVGTYMLLKLPLNSETIQTLTPYNATSSNTTLPKYLDININVARACNLLYTNANK